MAEFSVNIHEVRIRAHPNANRMEVAHIEGYQCCVGKESLKTGDLAAYAPDGALIPETLLREMGLEGKLAGPDHNRVRPLVLRGVLSQGLVIPAHSTGLRERTLTEGEDVAEILGITKYEPTPPAELRGAVLPAHGECLDFDVEDTLRHPDAIAPGERVVITEKLHGVLTCVGIGANGTTLVTSKGLGHKGFKFDVDATDNATNLHVAMWYRHEAAVRALYKRFGSESKGVYALGETIGGGLQDLSYGLGHGELRFHVFDLYIGDRRKGRWLGRDAVVEGCAQVRLACVPEIARMRYDAKAVRKMANGNSTLKGAPHEREGVVVRLAKERRDAKIGRVIVKVISPKHLLRKNATEYT